MRKAVCCGYLTSRNGTAAKLSFTDSHMTADNAAKNRAFAARNISVPRSLPLSSSYAHAPKNTTGTSPRSPMTLVQRAAETLRLRVRLLSTIRENGKFLLCGSSAVMRQSLCAAPYISGAAVSHLSRVHTPVTESCTALLPLKSSMGILPPKYSKRLNTAASAKRKNSSAAAGSRHIIIVLARLPSSSRPE